MCMPSTMSMFVTDTIECTDDNLFETTCKSNEDNLLDSTEELVTLLKQ